MPGINAPCPHGNVREALNLYVDGELPVEEQPALFAHLSACAPCRCQLESVLQFRRLVQAERVAVPPAADEAFMQRLAAHKKQRPEKPSDAPIRARRRRPLAAAAAVAAVLALFVMGVLVRPQTAPDAARVAQPRVTSSAASTAVESSAPPPATGRPAASQQAVRLQAVYFFYPGLTVEAERQEAEHPPATSL